MKKSGRSRTRRVGNRKAKSKDQVSLLHNADAPASPSVWGVDDGVGLFPSMGAPQSFDAMTQEAPITTPIQTQQIGRDTRLPPENRFLPQHEPRRGQSPADVVVGTALQFVPAYEESTAVSLPPSSSKSPPDRTPSKSPPSKMPAKKTFRNSPKKNSNPDASWDAVIEADDNSLKGGRSKKKNRSSNRSLDGSIDSLEEKKSTSGLFRRRPKKSGSSAVPTTVETKARTQTKAAPIDDSISEISGSIVSNTSRKSSRVARLAALFSSRAVVKGSSEGVGGTAADTVKEEKKIEPKQKVSPKKKNGKINAVPASPSQSHVSSGSSGYVVWPGTQDKRGKTVALESSYDDSSVGAAAFNRRNYEAELEDAADLEMHKWMNDEPSFEESSAGSPRRRARAMPLEQRIDGEESSIEQEGSFGDGNPADFHLAAVLADASVASPMARKSRAPIQNGVESAPSTANFDQFDSHRRPYRAAASSAAGASRTGAASSVGGNSASTAISIHNLFGAERPSNGNSSLPSYKGDPWDVDSSSHPPSSPGTSVSKDSSAYFMTKDGELPVMDGTSRFGIRSTNPRSIASVIRRRHDKAQPPTEEALAEKNRFVAGPRAFNAMNVKGYPGFLNKTRDVPNLMDAVDSDSIASSKATSMYSAPLNPHDAGAIPGFTVRGKELDDESDVFDGLSHVGDSKPTLGAKPNSPIIESPDKQRQGSRFSPKDDGSPSLVLLGGGLSTLQATQEDFDQRKTPSEFDENLTNSEVDQYGFAKTPGFNKMMTVGTGHVDTAKLVKQMGMDSDEGDGPGSSIMIHRPMLSQGFGKQSRSARQDADSSYLESESDISGFPNSFVPRITFSFAGDLSPYRIHPSNGKKLVRKYRKMCRSTDPDLPMEAVEREEDTKKAFALSEMRSRIMEKDIERGLERRGGSVVVDDLVLTPYYQASCRIRDAVIVSKAWRDGASPQDVVKAFRMTQRTERTYNVKRPIVRTSGRSYSPNISLNRSPNLSMHSDAGSVSNDYWSASPRAYILEPVQWLDDTDFMQMRCPSLGARNMRGFEMFTIGDCQSILLKLTNERCNILRDELNEATARQIEAEEEMKIEGDAGDGMMTEAEMSYLTAMEDVKTISKQLVVAEKSFNLVRQRIEKLVSRYEQLLVRIENDSIATASVLTYESSYYSEEYESDYSSSEEFEKEMFQRRAQRAELRAELAAREAILAKQEALKIKLEKQREIEMLQQKLAELQSESSHAVTDKDHSLVLAKAIAANSAIGIGEKLPQESSPNNDEKISGVKQRFRDRNANRMAAAPPPSRRAEPKRTTERQPPTFRSLQRRMVGEEMFQHLDFYERSLRAVETQN